MSEVVEMSEYTEEHFDEDHMDAYFEHKAAMASESLVPLAWDKWIDALEIEVGHSMDGDEDRDGFSLDYAHEAFNAGYLVSDYAVKVITHRHLGEGGGR